MNNVVPLLVAIPLGVGFLLPLTGRWPSRSAEVLCNATTLVLLLISLSLIGQDRVYLVGGWPSPHGIELRVDALTTLMLITTNGLASMVALYSVCYVCRYTSSRRYYSLLLFLIAGTNGVALTGDLFNLFVFMEITAIASYALVAFSGDDEAYEASFKYLVLGGLSSSAILIGITLLYAVTGTLNMTHLASQLQEVDGITPAKFALALFVCGFGLKAALVPFHAWLPDAYSAAPAPISAILSGVVSKVVGVYVLARLLFNVFGITDETLFLMRWMGGLTMVAGGLLALGQWDIKRLFAYSSVSQVGLIVLALGFGTTWGVVGALFHLVNHAVFKSLLFLSGGQVEVFAGTRDLRQMHGLRKRAPIASVTCMVGSLSLAGIPPLSGFWSKLIIVVVGVQTGHMLWSVSVIVMSIVALAYQLKVQNEAFYSSGVVRNTDQSEEAEPLASEEELPAQHRESSFAMMPMIVLATGCLALPLLALNGLEQPFLIGPAADALMRGIWTP